VRKFNWSHLQVYTPDVIRPTRRGHHRNQETNNNNNIYFAKAQVNQAKAHPSWQPYYELLNKKMAKKTEKKKNYATNI